MRTIPAHLPITTAAGLLCTGLVLAACSSGSSAGDSTMTGSAGAATAAPPGVSSGRNGFGGKGPAASGEIAARTGSTLQVQNSSTQTAVTFGKTTTFTAQKSTKLSAVTVGSCVSATSSAAASASSSTLNASTVRLSSATNGKCTGGGFGGMGPGGMGSGGRPPGGFPSGAVPSGGFPSGGPGGNFPSGGLPSGGVPTGARPSGAAGGFGGIAFGKVTKVSGSSITVTSSFPMSGGSSTSRSTTRTIAVTAATTYTTTVKTTDAAAKVGKCAVVQGKSDSSGAVQATSVALSSKTGGSCSTGFGGGNG